eukprot:TRINITY_DN13705_c0_g1_i1.p1 TRINITY_DN13705_c0_g1~~TRINITY_DN13705_c0_g1_i1.p1  ORF type:complete len:233 (-),score=24.74 TRINITY_DN13705_c0_g1_i1:137-835(-)
MSLTTKIAVGWFAFGASHLAMSHPPIRQELVKKLGDEQKFLGCYSLVSLGFFIPTTIFYRSALRQHGALFLRSHNPILNYAATGLRALALHMYAQTLVTPSPSAMKSSASASDPQGINRITRHPLFGSMAVWGVANLLVSSFPAARVFWAGFPIVWFAGSLHQDYRQRQKFPSAYYEKTSVLPFQAILEGRNSLSQALSEMSVNAALGALVVGSVMNRARVMYMARNVVKKM